jgi:hypothetical protein
VAGDEDINVIRHALEQAQRGEVVLDRVRGLEIQERDQGIGEHVAGDENAALLDPQGRMALGMRLVLDHPDPRAIPRDLRGFGGQPGDAAEQVVQRNRLGELGR